MVKYIGLWKNVGNDNIPPIADEKKRSDLNEGHLEESKWINCLVDFVAG